MRRRLVLATVVAGVMATAALPVTASAAPVVLIIVHCVEPGKEKFHRDKPHLSVSFQPPVAKPLCGELEAHVDSKGGVLQIEVEAAPPKPLPFGLGRTFMQNGVVFCDAEEDVCFEAEIAVAKSEVPGVFVVDPAITVDLPSEASGVGGQGSVWFRWTAPAAGRALGGGFFDIAPDSGIALHAHGIVLRVSCNPSGLSGRVVVAGTSSLPSEVWNQPLRGYAITKQDELSLCGPDHGNPPGDRLIRAVPPSGLTP